MTTATLTSGSLADYLRPQQATPKYLYEALLVLSGVAIVAASAQVSIPMPSGVPITGQTFAVLLVGAALGMRRGMATLTTYLLAGLAGAPIFAGGIGGPQVAVGPTMGFLIAFIPAAGLVGHLAERGWDRTNFRTIAAMTLGTAVIFAGGLLWGAVWLHTAGVVTNMDLSARLGTLMAGFFVPYLPGAAIKIALAILTLPVAWNFLGTRKG